MTLKLCTDLLGKAMIERLNYSTHAIEDLKSTLPNIDDEVTKKVTEMLIVRLQKAVKFILPDYGIYYDLKAIDQKHIDLLHLPFNIIAAEYRSPCVNLSGDSVSASKSIALALELHKDAEFSALAMMERPREIKPSALIWPIYYIDMLGLWVASYCGLVINYDQVVSTVIEENDSYELSLAEKYQMSLTYNYLDMYKVPIGKPYFDIRDRMDEKEFHMVCMRDAGSEMQAIVQLCSVLNCSNIKQSVIPAPSALNKKRDKKGKMPFYEYRVLEIKTDGVSKKGSGTHSSPRLHVRRGHPRHYRNPDNTVRKVVWIESTVVGKQDNGIIDKDYKV